MKRRKANSRGYKKLFSRTASRTSKLNTSSVGAKRGGIRL